MVYRATTGPRHASYPLRLGGPAPTRWWSRTASPARTSTPSGSSPSPRARSTRSPPARRPGGVEQPGCLHAGMDLYKHAFRLSPLVASDLVADCFELARDIRVLDMRASPYDLSGWASSPCGSRRPRASRSTSPRNERSPSAAPRCGPGWSRSALGCSRPPASAHRACRDARGIGTDPATAHRACRDVRSVGNSRTQPAAVSTSSTSGARPRRPRHRDRPSHRPSSLSRCPQERHRGQPPPIEPVEMPKHEHPGRPPPIEPVEDARSFGTRPATAHRACRDDRSPRWHRPARRPSSLSRCPAIGEFGPLAAAVSTGSTGGGGSRKM